MRMRTENRTAAGRSALLAAILFFSLGVIGLLAPGATAQIQGHSHDLPELTPDSRFPRCTPEELEGLGFPDHKHAWNWQDWEPLTDENGVAYGPGSMCWKKEVIQRDGLVVGKDFERYGRFVVRHHEVLESCDMLYFLELLELAGRDVPRLLGLALDDTLEVVSPDNMDAYRAMTGLNTWRLYQLKGDSCIPEPLPILKARTLDGHALYALVTEWLLNKSIPVDLPPWLLYGLTEYIGENGVHLVNYMAQFRAAGPVLFSPPLTDAILGGAPDPNRDRDREMYRRASYSAFLMVWELVENRGGLEAMRSFLAHLAEGSSLDEACRLVYGTDLQDLAAQLDPTRKEEPIGTAFQSRRPHVAPE